MHRLVGQPGASAAGSLSSAGGAPGVAALAPQRHWMDTLCACWAGVSLEEMQLGLWEKVETLERKDLSKMKVFKEEKYLDSYGVDS